MSKDEESTSELMLNIAQLVIGHIMLCMILAIQTIFVTWIVMNLNGLTFEWRHALSAILVAWLVKQWCRSEVKLKK